MSATINDYIKNEILEIHKREKDIDKFFAFEHIPSEKFRKAVNSYASSIGHDEVVIFFYDDTVFGSANEGFILTTKRLYYKNIMEKGKSIDVANILDITLKRTKLSAALLVRTDSYESEIQITTAEKNALFNVMNHTVGVLNSKNPASTGNTRQASASRSPTCRGCGANNTGNATRCEYCDSPL